MDTIVYVGGKRQGGDPLGLLGAPEARRLPDGSILFTRRGTPPFKEERRLVALSDPNAAAAFVREHPVEALVLDTRIRSAAHDGENPSQGGAFSLSRVGRVLSVLFPDGEVSGAIPRDRVIGLVGSGGAGAEAAYHFGVHRVGTVLSEPTQEALLDRVDEVLARNRGGRIAICLAGGGIEGLLYEIGVLRALDGFLVDRPVVDFDLFCGISAGAVLGAFLANGIGPNEIARGLAGDRARIDAIKRTELFDPNFRELAWRLTRMSSQLVRGGWGPRGALSLLARALPSAAFAGDGLREWLARQLTKPGMSDDFNALRRPLFVGATDQDTSEAVVFGDEGTRHVPVHRAVRASSALVPFYAPEQIDGRFYIDGAFTRTTNMRIAVREGASLVILVDPLVPTFSEEPGYVHARGGMFGTMQGLKSLINGRFDKAVRALQEMFPDVAFHLFRPEGDEMRLLSGSPMKYFYRRGIEEIAYERTVRKIREHMPELSRDFAAHGVTFRDPADAHPRKRPTRLEPSALGVS
jgi:predicted acylesterase/phospholipase RssA